MEVCSSETNHSAQISKRNKQVYPAKDTDKSYEYHESITSIFATPHGANKYCSQYTRRYASLHQHDDIQQDHDSAGNILEARVLLEGSTLLAARIVQRTIDVPASDLSSGHVLFFAHAFQIPTSMLLNVRHQNASLYPDLEQHITRWDLGIHRNLVRAHTRVSAFLVDQSLSDIVSLPLDMGRHGTSLLDAKVDSERSLRIKILKLSIRSAPRGKPPQLRHFVWLKETQCDGRTIHVDIISNQNTLERAKIFLESQISVRYNNWREIRRNKDEKSNSLSVTLQHHSHQVNLWIRSLLK